MIVRRYKGRSVEKLHDVIRQELGPHAVMVNTQKRRESGWIPGLGHTVFEITAVAEDGAVAAGDGPARVQAPAATDNPDWLDLQKQQYRGLRQSMRLIDEKLAEMDTVMLTLARRLPGAEEGPPELQRLHPEWRPGVLADVRSLAAGQEPATAQWLEALARRLPTRPGLDFRRGKGRPAVHVLVGPTGVGKTTTIAKLAAKCVLGQRRRTALITLDTFRVAGVEQLREYAGLLGVELTVAFSAGELQRHLERFADFDCIFVDTPGRSPFDVEGLADVQAGLGTPVGCHMILTVGANVPRDDVPVLVKAYAPFKPDAVIVTKVDEACTCDGLTRLVDITGLPVCYVTNGQRVPEDIIEAGSRQLAALVLLPGGNPQVRRQAVSAETPLPAAGSAPTLSRAAPPALSPPVSMTADPGDEALPIACVTTTAEPVPSADATDQTDLLRLLRHHSCRPAARAAAGGART